MSAAELANGSQGSVVSFKEYSLEQLLEHRRKTGMRSGDYWRTPEGTIPNPFGAHRIEEIYRRFLEDNNTSVLNIPEVSFNNGKRIPIIPVIRSHFAEDSIPIRAPGKRTHYSVTAVYRLQFPLILAWAMTIHKAQGSTLDCALADVENSFLHGQAYVGLSRTRSPENLQILGETYRTVQAIRTDPGVLKFYDILETRGPRFVG